MYATRYTHWWASNQTGIHTISGSTSKVRRVQSTFVITSWALLLAAWQVRPRCAGAIRSGKLKHSCEWMAMTAVRAMTAGGPASLSRFRGALVAAVLGDCVGGEFEGAEEVPMERVLQHLNSLDDETKGNGDWKYDISFKQNVTAVVLQLPTLNLVRPCWKIIIRVIPSNTAMANRNFHSFALFLLISLCCIFQLLHRSHLYTLWQPVRTKFRCTVTAYICANILQNGDIFTRNGQPAI